MSRPPKFKRGDIVHLNDEGIQAVFGYRGLRHMKTLNMKVTRISSESLTYPESCYDMDVDNADINRFVLIDDYFDLMR